VTPPTHRVEFELLGQHYIIRTELTPDSVRRLVAYIDARVKEVGLADPTKALALAALSITEELFHVREERSRLDGDVAARVEVLLKLLDEVSPKNFT
jgi:cell division protein ZapA (FtsZ GTPase activity inhibitor)